MQSIVFIGYEMFLLVKIGAILFFELLKIVILTNYNRRSAKTRINTKMKESLL
jgi:hypothetical protein